MMREVIAPAKGRTSGAVAKSMTITRTTWGLGLTLECKGANSNTVLCD